MIAWSINVARESGLFDRIIVSTDDDEVATVAEAYGAEVPFRRPAELSDDHAGTTAVVSHAVRWARDASWDVQTACCLYATAPFVRADDIVAGLQKLHDGNWAFCFTATHFASPIFRSFRQTEDGGLQMFFPDYFERRSQDLPEALHDAGQFYWGWPDSWIQGLGMFAQHSTPLVLPRWRVHDIDTPDDWRRAELVAKCLMGVPE